MATSKEYLAYVLDLLAEVPGVSHRAMMGEYLLYADGKLFGGIYDERLLVKDVPAARSLLCVEAIPYEGAKPMLLVDGENPGEIARLVEAMLPELPAPKPRKRAASAAAKTKGR